MKKIAVYGAGGLGRETACLIDRVNSVGPQWEIIGYFDDGVPVGTQVDHHGCVLGGMETLNEYPESLAVVMAIGSPRTVKILVDKIINPNIEFPNIICPTFDIVDPPTFSMGKGNVIKNMCRVSCNVKFGDFNMLNGFVIFGHDAQVGSYNSFMPNVRISGEVEIGDTNFFGIASIVLQGVHIGNNVRLGAASVLMRKPKEGCLYMGNPAKRIEL